MHELDADVAAVEGACFGGDVAFGQRVMGKGSGGRYWPSGSSDACRYPQRRKMSKTASRWSGSAAGVGRVVLRAGGHSAFLCVRVVWASLRFTVGDATDDVTPRW